MRYIYIIMLFLSTQSYESTDPVYLRPETESECQSRMENVYKIRSHAIDIFAERGPTFRQRHQFADQLDKFYYDSGAYDKHKKIYGYVASLSNFRGEYNRSCIFISEPTSSKSTMSQELPAQSNDSLEGLWVMDNISSEKDE